MSEAKGVSGFKPESQAAAIAEILWALAEAGAMLSMDPKISKPALKKLTWRERIVESKKVALFARAGLKVKL